MRILGGGRERRISFSRWPLFGMLFHSKLTLVVPEADVRPEEEENLDFQNKINVSTYVFTGGIGHRNVHL